MLQYGNYYVIDNCFDDPRYYSYIVISSDKSEAIMMISELAKCVVSKTWKAKGLDENAEYCIKMREQYNVKKEDLLDVVASGKELLEKGLDIGSL